MRAALSLAVVSLVVSGLAPRGALAQDDVPLALWTNPDFPGGLDFGLTNGISFGDYDRDGWIDVYAAHGRLLWQNVDGRSWLAYDLSALSTPGVRYYGSSFGDFNNDGYPDLILESRRFTACAYILENRGGVGAPDFVRLPLDRMGSIPCGLDAETANWADVDGDGNLDVVLPCYAHRAGERTQFWHNLGPRAEDGLYALAEVGVEAGYRNIPPVSMGDRPEGAQYVDLDFDGDLDFYTDGVLHQNVSSRGEPRMIQLEEETSGIGLRTELEEGIAFVDYDMDGDFDMVAIYTRPSLGVLVWENEGDGTFFRETTVVERPDQGLDLGISTEDWDNDGDMDLTTRFVFRRNMRVETGERRFAVATHSIPASHISSATPAWGDWDRDGDLDTALGNWTSRGHLYDNTLYDADTPPAERRYARVRVMRDSEDVEGGLETEQGATVELTVLGDDSGLRRRKFVSSSGGYLNQNEYTLHYGLPADPTPGDDATDLRFAVHVDFPSLPEEGFYRVDRHVNPVLADIHLADLADREITVFRSGAVTIDGTTHAPPGDEGPLLVTAGGGLMLPVEGEPPLPAPEGVVDAEWVAIDFDTVDAERRVRVRELIVDGYTGEPVACDGVGEGNAFLWDVSEPALPVSRGVFTVPQILLNHRNHVIADALLEKDRSYRLIVRLSSIRRSAFAGPLTHGDVTVRGGVRLGAGVDPCDAAAVAEPAVEADGLYVSFRYGPLAVDPCDRCAATETCVFDTCEPLPVPDAGPGAPDAGPLPPGVDGGPPPPGVDGGGIGTDAGAGGGGGDGGCGCAAHRGSPAGAWVALLSLAWLARRRRAVPR